MATVADSLVVVPPPPPEPGHRRRPDIAAAKAIMYLCLASLWVCCACLAAVAFGRHICDAGCPIVYSFFKVSAGAVLLAALHIPVFFLLLLRAIRAMGCGLNTGHETEAGKVSGASMWEVLRDTGVLGVPACFPFLLLLVTCYPVVMGLLPVYGSW